MVFDPMTVPVEEGVTVSAAIQDQSNDLERIYSMRPVHIYKTTRRI